VGKFGRVTIAACSWRLLAGAHPGCGCGCGCGVHIEDGCLERRWRQLFFAIKNHPALTISEVQLLSNLTGTSRQFTLLPAYYYPSGPSCLPFYFGRLRYFLYRERTAKPPTLPIYPTPAPSRQRKRGKDMGVGMQKLVTTRNSKEHLCSSSTYHQSWVCPAARGTKPQDGLASTCRRMQHCSVSSGDSKPASTTLRLGYSRIAARRDASAEVVLCCGCPLNSPHHNAP
jgi:hypothetical protein